MDPIITPLAIGAGANMLGSLIGGFGAQSAAEADTQMRKQMMERQIAEQNAAYGDIAPTYDPYIQAGEQGVRGLADLAGRVGEYDYSPEQFQYNQTTQDFLDPSIAFQQDQMRRQVEASAAAGGGLLSGGALKELQNRGAQLAQTDYGNAHNRMMNDKQFAYGSFRDNANAKIASLQQSFNNRANVANQQMGAGQFGVGGNASARMGVANNIGSAIGNQIDPMASNAQVGAAAPYMMGQGVMNSLVNQDTMQGLGQYLTPQGQQGQPSGNPMADYYKTQGGIPQGNVYTGRR
jgi:hypothetical protein